jgi:galactose-1-phosphate uridylyltransferase
VPRFASLAGFEVGLGSYINTVFPEEAARYLRGEAKS